MDKAGKTEGDVLRRQESDSPIFAIQSKIWIPQTGARLTLHVSVSCYSHSNRFKVSVISYRQKNTMSGIYSTL